MLEALNRELDDDVYAAVAARCVQLTGRPLTELSAGELHGFLETVLAELVAARHELGWRVTEPV